jgi:hypothetical protein
VSDPVRMPRLRFGPDRRWAVASGVGALVAVAVVVISNDPQQDILAFTAAIVLAAYTLADVYFWPRLTVDGRGLTLRTPTARTTVEWSRNPIVRVDSRNRLGLSSHTLEIDADELLVVFGRRALGADPQDVVDLVQAFRPLH